MSVKEIAGEIAEVFGEHLAGAQDFSLFVAGTFAGSIITWLILRSSRSTLVERARIMSELVSKKEAELLNTDRKKEALEKKVSELETRLEARTENVKWLQQAKVELTDAFDALSGNALKSNNQSFLELAKETLSKFQDRAKHELGAKEKAIQELVTPLKESLVKVDSKIEALEKSRVGAYSSITEQIKILTESQSNLQNETRNLVTALRRPNVRGRWGEIQLRRVVEMAGMLEYCDFIEQETVSTESSVLRPDLVVKLPNNKNVVVDSKAPLQSYLDALESSSEDEKVRYLKDHARQIRVHLQKLSEKRYWSELKPTPEFVVLFLPGETFFSAALEQDPRLIEFGVDQKVILATPTTLIALLRAVAYGWKQEQVHENAEQISQLGRELYERVRVMGGHFVDIKRNLERTVESYNKSVGSFESRVLSTTRKFKELGAGTENALPELEVLETSPRALQFSQTSESSSEEDPEPPFQPPRS